MLPDPLPAATQMLLLLPLPPGWRHTPSVARSPPGRWLCTPGLTPRCGSWRSWCGRCAPTRGASECGTGGRWGWVDAGVRSSRRTGSLYQVWTRHGCAIDIFAHVPCSMASVGGASAKAQPVGLCSVHMSLLWQHMRVFSWQEGTLGPAGTSVLASCSHCSSSRQHAYSDAASWCVYG